MSVASNTLGHLPRYESVGKKVYVPPHDFLKLICGMYEFAVGGITYLRDIGYDHSKWGKKWGNPNIPVSFDSLTTRSEEAFYIRVPAVATRDGVTYVNTPALAILQRLTSGEATFEIRYQKDLLLDPKSLYELADSFEIRSPDRGRYGYS